MRKPTMKTVDQLDQMNKEQFEKHRLNISNYSITVNYDEVKDVEVREYEGALTRYSLNRWGSEIQNRSIDMSRLAEVLQVKERQPFELHDGGMHFVHGMYLFSYNKNTGKFVRNTNYKDYTWIISSYKCISIIEEEDIQQLAQNTNCWV